MKLLRLVVKIQINPKWDSLNMSSMSDRVPSWCQMHPRIAPYSPEPCKAKIISAGLSPVSWLPVSEGLSCKRRGLIPQSCVTVPRRQILIQLLEKLSDSHSCPKAAQGWECRWVVNPLRLKITAADSTNQWGLDGQPLHFLPILNLHCVLPPLIPL